MMKIKEVLPHFATNGNSEQVMLKTELLHKIFNTNVQPNNCSVLVCA